MPADCTFHPVNVFSSERSLRSPSALRCAHQITEAIRQRRYNPEQRLGEATLAEELGFGRAEVRAALDQLAHAGIVERRPRSGTYVRRLTVRHYIELTEVRAALEAFAARMACTTATDEQLDQLGDLAAKLDKAAHDDSESWERLMELENEFHGRIAQIGGNQALIDIVVRHP